MNTHLAPFFGLEGKVALLTRAGGHLESELSRGVGCVVGRLGVALGCYTAYCKGN